ADFDPDLPVGLEITEGQMLAFDTLDDAAADMLGLEHPRHEFLIGFRQQEIGSGKFKRSVAPEPVDNLVEGAAPGNLREAIAAAVMDGHAGAVRYEFDIGIATGATDAELIRAAHGDIAR